MTRRNIRSTSCCWCASPLVILMFAMLAINEGQAVNVATLGVPVGIFGAFIVAHIATRHWPRGRPRHPADFVRALGHRHRLHHARSALHRQPKYGHQPGRLAVRGRWLHGCGAAFVPQPRPARQLQVHACHRRASSSAAPAYPASARKYGSKLWVDVGGFSFQPGEIAKIVIVLFLACYLAENREMLSVFTCA